MKTGHNAPSRPDRYVYLTPPSADHLPAESSASQPVAAVRGELLVRFRPTDGRARQQSALPRFVQSIRHFRRPSSSSGPGSLLKQNALVKDSVFDNLVLMTLEEDADLGRALAYFRSRPDVLYAEPNYRLRLAQSASEPVIPNDFDFAQLWGLRNVGQADGTAGVDIGMSTAWQYTTGDRRVVVAVADTGIDYYHPDLAGNIWVNTREIPGNGVDDDGNGYIDDVHGYDFVSDDSDPMDDHGHGTHVAGTIGAVGNNGIGISGVCWEVSLMGLKTFDESGNGEIATAVESIRYAIENGAHIINASWGNNERSRALDEVIQEAHRAGLMFIAAAGNDNSENLFYPGAYDNVVAVAATDARDRRSRFSDFGAYVDVAAPGENIYSTLPNNTYGFFSGTSMATPHVAGVAALVLSRNPHFSNRQVENILRNSVDLIAPDKYIGTGRINAADAVRVDRPLPDVRLRLPELIFGDIDIDGTASGDRFVRYFLEYGQGANPTNWIAFHNSDTPVAGGTLFEKLSTSAVGEGLFTFRLTAHNSTGERAVERASVQISNVHIASPNHNDILAAGARLDILGTVFGEGRTYRIEHGAGLAPSSWSDLGVELANGGTLEVRNGLLAVWDTSLVAPNQFYTLKLTGTARDNTVTESFIRMIYLDGHLKPGWPRYLPVTGNFPPEDWRHFIVADIDQDGFDEIVLVDHGNSDGKPASLLVYRHDGSLFWSKELASGYPYSDIPVAGDITGDGFLEIFVDVGSEKQLFGFRHDGTLLPGKWPVRLEASGLGKVMADLEGDGRKELIGYSQASVSWADYRQLVVFDAEGNLLRKWDVPNCRAGADQDLPRMLPAVGNLDADPDLEIVAVSGCGTVATFKFSKAGSPWWTTGTGATFLAPPAIGDLNGNGTNEIVIAAFAASNAKRGGVYAFNNTGAHLAGWPVLVEESFIAPPALADVNRDGRLEISIPSAKSGLIHLLQHDGFELRGWPVGPVTSSSVKSSTVIGDVDGDGYPDIVLSSPGYMSEVVSNGDLHKAGGVKAWTASGREISLSGSGTIRPLLTESSGGTWLKASPVTLADIDRNGKLNIVAVSIQDRTYLPFGEKASRKNRSSIYVWELDVPWMPENVPWPMFQGNPEHTGYLPAPRHENQPPTVAGIPSQIIAPGAAFFPIDLNQYVEDPDHAPRELSWTVSGHEQLGVELGANHVLTIRIPGPEWTGRETLRIMATDPGGLESSLLVTFEVRAGYVAPIATPDHVTTLEDEPVEIDVLANDSDPAHHPLTIAGLSRPSLGRVTRTAQGTLLYTPAPDANGTDTFNYTLSNGQGGMSVGSVLVEIVPVNDPPRAEPDRVIIDEDTFADIDVLANDSEPDGESIILLDFTQPENGRVTRSSGDLLRYVPETDFFGLDTFTYTIADSSGLTSEAAVSVMVKPVNDLPVAQDQTFTLNRNSSQSITFKATDPDDTEFTFSIVDSPIHGTLWNYPKVATYYPTNGFSGTDSFTYRANDGKEDGPVATVHLNVLNVNNPPEAEDRSLLTKVDQARVIQLEATDLDADLLTYAILSQPIHGTLTGADNHYLYQPALGFLGKDAFTFQAFDGQNHSRIATIQITVTDQNSPPVAEDFSVKVIVNTPTEIDLRANDPESTPLNFHVVTRPAQGKLTGKGQTLLYSPNAHFAGSDRFAFKASDGELESNVATVSISVDSANQAPVSTNQQVAVLKNTPTLIQLKVTDADGDTLRCPILKGPKNGRLTGSGTTFTYTPKAGFVGTDSFTYKAWDGLIYSAQAKVSLNVNAPPQAQPLAFQSVTQLPDGRVHLTLTSPGNAEVEVLVSTNLIDWEPLAVRPTPGETSAIIDVEAPHFSQRFYRALAYPTARLE